jgi:hypothetical protein
MTEFGEIPPAPSAGSYDPTFYVMYSYILSASYLMVDALQDLASKIDTLQSSVSQGSNAASLLVQEYYSKQDLDGDSLIYGIDFYIYDPPEALASIPVAGTRMSWVQYQTNHPELF